MRAGPGPMKNRPRMRASAWATRVLGRGCVTLALLGSTGAPGPVEGLPQRGASPAVSEKTAQDRQGEVAIGRPAGETGPEDAARILVRRLSFARYKANVRVLAGFGTRYFDTEGNERARDWIQARLESFGYVVERHRFRASTQFQGGSSKVVDSVYATKVGTLHPDRMYVVSAHMDSINFDSVDQSFAPGADDDASGTSLVLEVARVLATRGVDSEVSVRFVLWNAEEIGLQGSTAYVRDRRALQGVEDPPGSGRYPEPSWLGLIQHDMLLFDHGLPGAAGFPDVGPIPEADVDVEFDADAPADGAALELASKLLAANGRYATMRFPAEVGQFMQSTDSVPFAPFVAAVSVRENERRREIGEGSNPHWHRDTDVASTYRDADFRLGFTAAQMTTGAVAELAGASVGR